MPDSVGELFLAQARREFRTLKELADQALVQTGDGAFFSALDAGSNSMAALVKHLSGNMQSRWTDFLTTDGEKPNRDRDHEFEILAADTRGALNDRWESGWTTLFQVLESLVAGDLERSVRVRGEPLPVLRAITRQMTHYGYHVGQIVLLAKHARGAEWRTLSIQRGGSEAFNLRMREWHGGAC